MRKVEITKDTLLTIILYDTNEDEPNTVIKTDEILPYMINEIECYLMGWNG